MTIRSRWDAMPERRRVLLRWGLPLLGLGVLIALDWWHLQQQGIATPRTGRQLLGRVGIASAVSALVMMIGVRRWPIQSLGLFSMLIGLAGLFVRLSARIGPQPVGERERDAIQAALDVGSILLLAGLIIWAVSRLRGRGPADLMDGD